MTPEQLALVQRTATVVAASGDDFARSFYDHLFELHPSARHLFPEDLRAQPGELTDEILFLVAEARDLPAFCERARRLGARYRSYGMHAADYPFVGDALVAAVAEIAADNWSPLADAAWHRMYALISETMIEGAACAALQPTVLTIATG